MNGYVYILSNESMPGLYKIGSSRQGGQVRAKSFSSSTGCPKPFTLVFEIFTPDCRSAEKMAHELLADSRYSRSREFFECSEFEAVEAVSKAALMDYELMACHSYQQEIIDAFILLSKKKGKPHPQIWATQILLEDGNA